MQLRVLHNLSRRIRKAKDEHFGLEHAENYLD